MTHQSVYTQLARATTAFEGFVPHLYLDVKGKVTVGYGFLVTSQLEVTMYPFYTELTRDLKEPMSKAQLTPLTEVTAAFRAVRDSKFSVVYQPPKVASIYGNLPTNRRVSLPRNEADKILIRKADIFMRMLTGGKDIRNHRPFEEFPNYHPNLQLALTLMMWAIGPAGIINGYPKFTAAIRDKNYFLASTECGIDTKENPGIIPRNTYVKTLLEELGQLSMHYTIQPSTTEIWHVTSSFDRKQFTTTEQSVL